MSTLESENRDNFNLERQKFQEHTFQYIIKKQDMPSIKRERESNMSKGECVN